MIFLLSKAFFFQKKREIAITIDDLPFIDAGFPQSNQYVESIAKSLIKHKALAIGFVIANRVHLEELLQVNSFKNNGFALGNHSFSHRSLRETPVTEYIQDIAKADQILSPILSQPKYYRYPYMAEGNHWWIKKAVHQYLIKNNYTIAPVTIDSHDYLFNLEFSKIYFNINHPDFLDIKKRYLDYIWAKTLKAEWKDQWLGFSYVSKKQVLLSHANILNSILLDSILSMYEAHGYHFISIQEVAPPQVTIAL